MDRNVKLKYNSTLEGSILMLTCENDISNIQFNSTDKEFLYVTCHSSGNWIPDPAQFTCLPPTTVPPGSVSCIFVSRDQINHWVCT